MRLNLGAADRNVEGFKSVDLVPPADFICDLTEDWPWPASSIEEILANDILEHLPNKRHTMNEIFRVLKPGGLARIGVPDATQGDGGFCDPTHVSFWSGSDFEYYEAGNYARERKAFAESSYYGIKARFDVVEYQEIRHERKRGRFTVELRVVLRAVK
jgi:ubiquinone/menaquinone biosynthesis C-methylase UbiE